MSERMIASNGIEMWTESFGNPAHPTVLLIMGMFTQGIFWSDALIGMIVASGRHVIRYDNRDVGRSSCFDFAAEPYTFEDLAADAVGVLDAWDAERAHIVGLSMGGMIAQELMIDSPERILSATIACSSPIYGDPPYDLPLGPWAVVSVEAVHIPTDRESWIGQYDDPMAPDNERLTKAGVAWNRACDVTKARNHILAFRRSAPNRCPFLAGCNIPTTIVHGRDDPIFPPSHAEALATAIPNAKLAIFDDMGHGLALLCWPTVVDSVA